MSAITRAKLLIEALKDKTVPDPLALKIVEGCLKGNGVDVTNMVNEQKAQAFLNLIKTEMIEKYRHGAYISAEASSRSAIDIALANADNDFK